MRQCAAAESLEPLKSSNATAAAASAIATDYAALLRLLQPGDLPKK
jgi:hypothetical protein